MATSRLTAAKQQAGRLNLMAGHILVKTFSPRTRAKGNVLATTWREHVTQAEAAKKRAAKLVRQVRNAVAAAKRQQAQAITKARAKREANRLRSAAHRIAKALARDEQAMSWPAGMKPTAEAQAKLRTGQADDAQLEREVIADACARFDRATNRPTS